MLRFLSLKVVLDKKNSSLYFRDVKTIFYIIEFKFNSSIQSTPKVQQSGIYLLTIFKQ